MKKKKNVYLFDEKEKKQHKEKNVVATQGMSTLITDEVFGGNLPGVTILVRG